MVVNAAGAWAAEVAALAGIQLPVEPMRRMLIPTEPFDGVSHEVPMVIDMTNGFHFRPESLGFLLAWNDPEETTGFNTNFDPAFIEKVLVQIEGLARKWQGDGTAVGNGRAAPARASAEA